MSETSSIRSELRAVLQFWSGVVCGLLIGLLAAQLAGVDQQPPAAAAPTPTTIVKETKIMPAWMRDGKILTTADGKAVIICDDCPCGEGEAGPIETPCCERRIPNILHATITALEGFPDCACFDGTEVELTYNPDSRFGPSWEGSAFVDECDQEIGLSLSCDVPGTNTWGITGGCPLRVGTTHAVAQCDPFEVTFESGLDSNCGCGGDGFRITITE